MADKFTRVMKLVICPLAIALLVCINCSEALTFHERQTACAFILASVLFLLVADLSLIVFCSKDFSAVSRGNLPPHIRQCYSDLEIIGVCLMAIVALSVVAFVPLLTFSVREAVSLTTFICSAVFLLLF